MSKKDSGAGCIVGLLIFMAFGLFFIFEVPFSIFSSIFQFISEFIPYFPLIFIFIFVVAAGCTSSEKSKGCKTEQKNYNQYHYKQAPSVNPYIVRSSVRNDVQTSLVEDYKSIEPIKSKALFCQFCGTRIDKDARFCHQCGSKLD